MIYNVSSGTLNPTIPYLYHIVYYYSGAQTYEQFLQVGGLDQGLILLGLTLCLSSASVSLILMMLYIFKILLHSVVYLLVS